MGLPRRFDLPREHASIDTTNLRLMRIYNHSCMAAAVTCPHCGGVRWYPLGTLRQQLERPNFNGQCRPCGRSQTRAGFYRWAYSRPGRRTISTNGYVQLGPTAVAMDDLPMFQAMRGKGGFVFEHRWVMAKHLNRPLRSDECIDHMDGNKTHNAIENLRIYLKGKNQAGSGNGYGTYYHELQMAEAKVRELEFHLATLARPA